MSRFILPASRHHLTDRQTVCNIYVMDITGAKEKFWSYVNKTDTCWVWTGTLNKAGYGIICIYDPAITRGRTFIVSRVSWYFHFGSIPKGMNVLHRCDNPPCVNPDHLWLGTHKDNARDRSQKGRDRNSRKTHCKRGHEFTDINRLGHRSCRICHAILYKQRRNHG